MSNEELIKEINKLQAENTALKENILINSSIESTPKTLEDYYSRKYLETFKRVRKARLEQVKNEIKELTNKKVNVDYEIDHAQELIKENNIIQTKVLELQAKFDKNKKTIENQASKIYEKKANLLKKQENLKDNTLKYYDVIYKTLNPIGDNVTILQNIDFVYNMFLTTLYDENIKCRELNLDIMNDELNYENLIDTLRSENEKLLVELDTETKKLRNIDVEDLEESRDSLVQEIAIKNRLLNELDETYIELKDKDIKSIIDKISYLKVIGKSQPDIAVEASIYLKKLEDNLKSTDTIKHTRAIKELELKNLIEEKNNLEKTVSKYRNLKQDLDYMQERYNKASKNLDILVDYIDNVTLAVSENLFYYDTVKQYEDMKKDLADKKALHAEKDQQYQKLLDKKLEMKDPTIQELQPILDELKDLQTEKNELSSEITRITDQKNKLETSPAALKILCVVKEKELAESSLATLFDKLRKLSGAIEKTHQKLDSFKKSLADYDELLSRIEVLKDEINN